MNSEADVIRRFGAELLDPQNHLTVRQAEAQIRDDPGIYAIHLLAANSIPSSFASHLISRNHRCLYIGKTRNGARRLVKYDLCGGGPSTFFCSLGLTLGYSPRPGSMCGQKDQDSFRFTETDTDCIVAWSRQNLVVGWRALPESAVEALEAPTIEFVRPLFNLKHNPCRLSELEGLRRRARDVARAPVAESTLRGARPPKRNL